MPTFLASAENRPYLRLLDWETGEERALPDGADVFTDRAIPRVGWTALGYNMGAVALPDPALRERPLHLPGLHPAPHEDPALLWLTDDDGVATPRDRFGRVAGSPVSVPAGWLVAAYEGTWLQWDPDKGSITYWDRHGLPTPIGGFMRVATAGRFALLVKHGMREARVLDMQNGSDKIIERRDFSSWGRLASPSPDGSSVALSVRVADQGPERPEGMPIIEWTRERERHPKADDTEALVFVDLAAATCAIASGTFENFARRAAWTADGSACAFGIPFEPGTTVGWVSRATMHVERRRLPRSAGTPMTDITRRMPRRG